MGSSKGRDQDTPQIPLRFSATPGLFPVEPVSAKAAREGSLTSGYLFSQAQYRAPSAGKIIAARNTKKNAIAINSKFIAT